VDDMTRRRRLHLDRADPAFVGRVPEPGAAGAQTGPILGSWRGSGSGSGSGSGDSGGGSDSSGGGARQAIVDFVESVTRPGPGFVPATDRIAAFDNDGTLWVEQPTPPQVDFFLRAWAEEAEQDPSLAAQLPYRAIIERDPVFFDGLAKQDPVLVASVVKAAATSWAGTTPDVFDRQVRQWAETVRQPRFGVAYTDLVFKPMLELVDYLKANEFRVFVCSGGGRDFMRVFAEEIWGLPKENVIGTSPDYEYADGRMVRTDRMLGGLDLGPGKPEHLFAHTGRLPLLAAGNGDVDIELLTTAKFALLINHDDADREYSYTKAAENSLARAEELGWTVVSMKDDWDTVFQD
jgi:phosphoserine phosphatase